MGYDAFAPLCPARINAKLVPAGRIRASRFDAFVARLQEHRVVALDTSYAKGEQGVDRQLGKVVYDFSPAQADGWPSLDAFPFDLNRQVQAELGLADGKEFLAQDGQGLVDGEGSPYRAMVLDFERLRSLSRDISDQFLLIFDAPSSMKSANEHIHFLSSTDETTASTTTALSALTRMLLAQTASVVRELESSAIDPPRIINRARDGTTGFDSRSGNSAPISRSPSVRSSSAAAAVATGSNSHPSEEIKPAQKARHQIVLGAFYLQAGRRLEALREFSDGASGARASSDYLWHGKALEYLLVCMLMLSWDGIDFEIPQICRPGGEKSLLSRTPQDTPPAGSPNPEGGSSSSREVAAGALQDLAQLVPTLISTILTLYVRSSSFTQERLPPIMMCEARLRCSNLLFFLYTNGVTFNSTSLSILVLGTSPDSRVSIAPTLSRSRRAEIAALLVDAANECEGAVNNSESVHGLIGIACGLSRLGFDRKQAFYLKQLLQKLIPCLVEARKIGAAEMGIHPAAGLSIVSGSQTEGVSSLNLDTSSLLKMIGALYGMSPRDHDTADENQRDLDLIKRRLLDWISSQRGGDMSLKLEILRLCINMCEALPDLVAGLRFTILLLQTARRTLTMSSYSISGTPSLSTEEQSRLMNSIKRTVNAAPKIGYSDLRAEYWDDYIIRGIQLFTTQDAVKLIPHTSQDLVTAVGDKMPGHRDPFIYNPFSKAKAAADTSVLVVGEMAHFAVTLQNPFEFDLEIEHLSLLTEGCAFEAKIHNTILGHFCTQDFIVSGTPQSSGVLRVTGCRIRIRNCYERSFYIFNKEWHPQAVIKLKRPGLRLGGDHSSVPDGIAQATDSESVSNFVQPDSLSTTAIQTQPELSIIGSNLSQPSLMLLEGERREFEITIRNSSKTASADLLLFAFEDSVTTQLQSALLNRDLSPAEIYEVQLQLATNPSIRWKSNAEQGDPQLPADSSRTFTFEAFGKPGLTSATVRINYAHLGKSITEIKEIFYTRQISFDLSLTVNGSVDVARFNVLPLSDNFTWQPAHNHLSEGGATNEKDDAALSSHNHLADNLFTSQLAKLKLQGQRDMFCLCLVDFRNVWPHPINIEVLTGEAISEGPNQDKRITASDTLQPGHVSRILLLIPRIFVSDPSAPVPTLGNQRQFVLSASKMSMEAEAASREAFWYREELLKFIGGTWKEVSTGREGIIDFRKAVRLSPRMVDAIRIDHVEIAFSIQPFVSESSNGSKRDENCVRQLGKSRFGLHTETFATLTVRVHNNTKERLQLLLRLQPSLRDQPHNIALELSKRFAWSGVLQRALHPVLEPGDIREAQLGITALVEGDFEIGATVEEIQGRRPIKAPAGGSMPTLSTDRRIWHAREPCLIDAVRGEAFP